MADVKGQLRSRRALEISAAGGHSPLLKGPLGTKTLLASRLPSILPALNPQENLEVASIYSIVKTKHHFGQRPFRAQHHTPYRVCNRSCRWRLSIKKIGSTL